MNRIYLAILFVTVIASCSQSNNAGSFVTSTTDVDTDSISEEYCDTTKLEIDDFELDFFKEVAKSYNNQSFVTSPASASFAAAMVANICDKSLQSRIIEALGFERLSQLNRAYRKRYNNLIKNDGDDGNEIFIGNSLWIAKNRFLKFGNRKDSLKEYFNAFVSDVNFKKKSTFEKIANWGKDVSRGYITPSLSGLDEQCGFVLMNLLYYSGAWTSQFKKYETKKDIFHKVDGDIEVNMMHQTDDFEYYNNFAFQAVIIYLMGRYSMILILPNDNYAITNVISDLDFQQLKTIVQDSKDKGIDLYLPKFEIGSGLSITDQLKKLGLNISPSQLKNIGMTVNDEINMDQYARITIDEEGVKATAETAVSIILGIPEETSEPIIVRFDKPFIFMLRNNITESIISAGVYTGSDV